MHGFIQDMCKSKVVAFLININIRYFADAASEPEASKQVRSYNSYWALKVRFYFRFSIRPECIAVSRTECIAVNARMLCMNDAIYPRANGAKRRSGRKPGARVTNSARLFTPGKCEHSEVQVQSSSMIAGASLWLIGGPH